MATHDIEMVRSEMRDLKMWRDPELVLAEAQQAAQALQKRIAGKKKPVMFNGEQYIEIDDWEMVGHFFGYVAKVESTEFVEYGEVQGFKASAVLLNEHTGLTVSRAEAVCLDEEENWGPRPKYEWQKTLDPSGNPIWDKKLRNGQGGYLVEKKQVGEVDTPLFQLLSMAQTRACAKCFRNKLAWVVVLAGYKPTPAEEMDSTILPKDEPLTPATTLPTEIKRKESSPVPVNGAQPTQAAPPSQSVAPRPEPVKPFSRPVVQSPRPANVRVISDGQSRRFYALWKSAGKEKSEVDSYLREVLGITTDKDIPASRYEEACAWASKGDF